MKQACGVIVVGVLALLVLPAPRAEAETGPGAYTKPELVCGTPNGCGPAGMPGSGTVNGYRNVSFKPACTTHDYCYAMLGKTQAECDSAFRNDMYAACAQAKEGADCRAAADLFYNGPSKFGASAFQTAQTCSWKVEMKNWENDVDFVIANARNEGSRRADEASRLVRSAASDKRRVIQDGAAEIKTSTERIHELAGMIYTYSPPAPASGGTPTDLRAGGPTALSGAGGAAAASLKNNPCLLKMGNDGQLCNLAGNAKRHADATATRVPKEDMKYDDELRDALASSQPTILAKYVDPAVNLARECKTMLNEYNASMTHFSKKAILQAQLKTKTDELRLRWNAIKSEIDRELRASGSAPFKNLNDMERQITGYRTEVAGWKTQAEKLATPTPTPTPMPIPKESRAPRPLGR